MSFKKYGVRFLQKAKNFRVPEGVTSRAIEEYLQSLDCPRALTVFLLYSNMEHEQLANLEFDPLHYESSGALGDAYAATKFLSKFKGLTLDYDLDKVALEKFEKFESLCKRTNNRFRHLSYDPLYRDSTVRLHSAVVRKIERLLGDFNPEEFLLGPNWGPGASTLIKRRFANSPNKFQCETGITRDLHDLVTDAVFKEVYPHWYKHLFDGPGLTYQVGNKVVTVPKDATTNRVIAIEPGINLWFQLSLGDMIERRLRRDGVDLRWQSKNQQLARLGSKDLKLATVDLSSASDSIAVEVVRELLPPRWFMVMDTCRSHYGASGGNWRKWEKFSSMGNGFTFPLESLIFYAVASCCKEYLHDRETVSVYGDDVILPKACLKLFSTMLDFYGFQLNWKKSHFDSTFRESCGAHYVDGVDVKPIYLKDRLSSVLSVYRLANAIRRLAHRRCGSLACDARFQTVFEYLVSSVPGPLRLRIPEGLGDGGFVSNFDEATPSRLKDWIEGYQIFNLTEVSKTYQEDRVGVLLHYLWQFNIREFSDLVGEPEGRTVLEASGALEFGRDSRNSPLITVRLPGRKTAYNTVPFRNSTKLKVARSTVSQWYNLGPWFSDQNP